MEDNNGTARKMADIMANTWAHRFERWWQRLVNFLGN